MRQIVQLQYLFQRMSMEAKFNSPNTYRFTNFSQVIFGKSVIPKIKEQNFCTKRYFSSNNSCCWKCGASTQDFIQFCAKCHSILPFHGSLSYFQILGVQKNYQIDKKQLSMQFRKLQSFFHPDKFSIKSTEEQKIAQQNSSMLNKAYSALGHPVSRAEYLLDLTGQPLEEGEINVESNFLMEIMDINERLADAEDKETISEIGRVNNQIMDNLARQANDQFVANDIKAARAIVAKMKYYNNIYEKVKEQELKYDIMY